MSELLGNRGLSISLNKLELTNYDIALVHWANLEIIQRILKHSPECHIGVLNPGELGYPKQFQRSRSYRRTQNKLKLLVNSVDFFVVTTVLWKDLLLQYNRRTYLTTEYDFPDNKTVKSHTKTNRLTIGYHGNTLHYVQDFFPYGANALMQLAQEYDLKLKIITNNASSQPTINGLDTEFIDFDLNTFPSEIATFDIGICPVFSEMSQLADPYTYIRNSNRVNTLLWYGIPSVTSPIPQACHDLTEGETVLFAVSEAGWYTALKRLIVEPELRNHIGSAGRELVEKKYSAEVVSQQFLEMLHEEIKQPLFPKLGPLEISTNKIWRFSLWANRMKRYLQAEQ